MILITGAAGFIGSKFIRFLNNQGIDSIVACDYLTKGQQFKNLVDLRFSYFATPERALNLIKSGIIDSVFHFGAISDTTCWDGELVMERNYNYTVDLISTCTSAKVPVSYSSSASVYGNGDGPINLYAYSKYLVDQYVSKKLALSPEMEIQGFRYFNVYSTDDAEWHKRDQASPFYKFKQQALETGEIKIFQGSEGFYRDFVHVDQVCEIQWAMSKRKTNGIFDLGSGKQMSFKEVADYIAKEYSANVVIIPFPEHLKGVYQTNTLANMDYLRPQ